MTGTLEPVVEGEPTIETRSQALPQLRAPAESDKQGRERALAPGSAQAQGSELESARKGPCCTL